MKIFLIAFLCLHLVSGCGGSSPRTQYPPLYTQAGEGRLYAPLLGSYAASWSQVGGQLSGTSTIVLGREIDPTGTSRYLNISVTKSGTGNLPPMSAGMIGATGYAVPGSITLDSTGTAVTRLAISYIEDVTTSGTSTTVTYWPYGMVLNVTSPSTLSGTVTNYSSPATTYNITLTKQ